jgi:hypothetical protein
MCLLTKQLKPLVATSDIRVWKVLSEDDVTPYMKQQFHHGRNVPVSENHELSRVVLPSGTEFAVVNGGYLHAFKSNYAALYEAAVMTEKHNDGKVWPFRKVYKVIEMRVPAGAQYWLGITNDIAATELIWDEQPEASVTKARQ